MSLFKPPKHKWLAKIVSFKNPSSARKSAKKLVSGLKRGRIGKMKIGKKRALQIVKALNYAANRAEAAAKKKDLSAKERKELKRISRIYRSAQEKASRIYARRYKE